MNWESFENRIKKIRYNKLGYEIQRKSDTKAFPEITH